jgi:hypothetical protein
MEAAIEPGQPLGVAARSFTRRFREWTLTASRRRGPAQDGPAQRSAAGDEATVRQPGAMIRPSTHESVALACRTQDWP